MTENLKRNLALLNEPQLEAVKSEGKQLLVLSGAGSGKTRVITTRIAYMIEERHFSPSSILAVTFTNKAAKEMRTRLAEMIPGADALMIRTFHSFGAWILRRNGSHIGLSSNFTIYDDQDTLSLLKSLDLNLDKKSLRRNVSLISSAKDYLLNPDNDLSDISSNPDFKKTFALYEEKLRRAGNVDFGDLIALPVKLLQEVPEIRDRIRQRFRAILVDEYQDSNFAQFQLLKELTLSVLSETMISLSINSGGLWWKILSIFPNTFRGLRLSNWNRIIVPPTRFWPLPRK